MSDKKMISQITDENFSKEVEKGITLVDFHAVWCGPCRMLSPILEEVAEEYKDKAKVAKVDIDTEQKIAARFQVTSVPTLILFKDGKEVNRLIGLRDASSISDFIKSAL